MTFNAEFKNKKKNKNPPKDPVGQLIAGIEKTMGDIFFKSVQ